jgi:hypothetical protein
VVASFFFQQRRIHHHHHQEFIIINCYNQFVACTIDQRIEFNNKEQV